MRELEMKEVVEVGEVGVCGWRWREGWGGRGGGCEGWWPRWIVQALARAWVMKGKARGVMVGRRKVFGCGVVMGGVCVDRSEGGEGKEWRSWIVERSVVESCGS